MAPKVVPGVSICVQLASAPTRGANTKLQHYTLTGKNKNAPAINAGATNAEGVLVNVDHVAGLQIVEVSDRILVIQVDATVGP